MEILYTKKKFKYFKFLLLYKTRRQETILKVSVNCLSEEVFICQTAGLDALEIVKLLKTQPDS